MAKDCCVEYELADTYAQRLVAQGLEQFYENHLCEVDRAVTGDYDARHKCRRKRDETALCEADSRMYYDPRRIDYARRRTTIHKEIVIDAESFEVPVRNLKLRKQTTKGKVTVNEVALRRNGYSAQN